MAETAIAADGATLTKVADVQPATPATSPAVTPAPAGNDPAKPGVDAAAVPAVKDNLLADGAAKPGEAKPADPAAVKPAELKPEDYKITLPDGLAKDDGLLTSFLAGAAKHGVPEAAVQAVINDIAPTIKQQLAAPHEAWKTLQESWQSAVKADPEIGGAKLSATVATINKAIAQFGDAAQVTEALRVTGAGNNPAIIRLLHSMASKLTEGTPVNGAAPPQGSKRGSAELLYNHPTSISGQPRNSAPPA